jgi:glycosyltransferase involved in cell wall biosynthesis
MQEGVSEIIVYDDGSTDGLEEFIETIKYPIKYKRGYTPSGTGNAFNKAMSYASGDIIITMCADDIFTDRNVVRDIVKIFDERPLVGAISHYYYQFVNGHPGAVRAWRGNCPVSLANNPSGLAFRRRAIGDNKFSNLMFVEASAIIKGIQNDGWIVDIMKWDTVAVRVHNSISTNAGYYLKRWKSSPIEEWARLGAGEITTDFTSLIQIKNWFTDEAVWEEIKNFVKVRKSNLLRPDFYLFSFIAMFIPRVILRKLPLFYRHRIGRFLTKEIKRPCQK